MKKIFFLLLIGGVLFLINYLADITLNATDKVSDNALDQLIATGNKPVQNQPTSAKPVENKQTVVEQVTNTVTPFVKQVTDTTLAPLNNTKPPIATIKIYDKKNAKEITIATPAQLEAQQQAISPQQQQEEENKAEKFRAYYHKSEKCLAPSSHDIRIECGNEHMRAKAKFEELYKQGKI